jgi:diguanylate cyclase (GGDEF)-like protein
VSSTLHVYLTRLPAVGIFLLAAGAVALIGLVDYSTGYEISLAILYFGPVAFATWYANRSYGYLAAVLATVVGIRADLSAGHAYTHSVIPFWNGFVQLAFYLISVRLMDMLRARLHVEQRLARTDALTGILNSRAFVEHMGYIIALARRDGAPMTLAYIDLDNFKQVNDNHGHSEGNRLLQLVGRTLRDSVRQTDAVARLGGDEFALLLPVTDADAAKKLVGKLKLRLDRELSQGHPTITCSVGAVTFLQPPASADAAIRIADGLMYQAKRQGKNAAVFETIPTAIPLASS